MARFRRRGGFRRFKKRRGGRLKRRIKRMSMVSKGKIVVNPQRSLSIYGSQWPEAYRTSMRMQCTMTAADGTGTSIFAFMANNFGDGTTNTIGGCGPWVNAAGKFLSNFPAGLKGLIQTPSLAGTGVAPYQFYRIPRSRMYYRVIPTPIAASVLPSAEIRCIAFPTTQHNYTGAGFSALGEQPYCRFHTVPYAVFGTATTTAANGGGSLSGAGHDPWHHVDCYVGPLFGMPTESVHTNGNFHGSYNSAPQGASVGAALPTGDNNTAYYQIAVIGDGSGHMACEIEVKIVYDTIFYQRNYNLTSAVNV